MKTLFLILLPIVGGGCHFATFHYHDIKTGQIVITKAAYGQEKVGDTILQVDGLNEHWYKIEAIDTSH